MPGAEGAYVEGTRFPKDQEEHAKLLKTAQEQFDAADRARQPHYERWRRDYQLYRSHVERKPGDWTSKVFVPIAFWVVETITPKLVAPPKFLVHPVEEADEGPADVMEKALDWSIAPSGVRLEIVKAEKSALKYGTGILKTFYDRETRWRSERVAKMRDVTETVEQEVIDPETGQPLLDPDQNPVTETVEVPMGQEPETDEQGQPVYTSERVEYVTYDGPRAEWVDIFNFWVSPEATDIDDARYVIHRAFMEWSEVLRLVEEGVYKLPENFNENDLWTEKDDPKAARLSDIGLEGQGEVIDPTRRMVEMVEIWTDRELVTMGNRRAILRVQDNPQNHGEKPFVRIVDHLVEGEFWGIGEIEPLEGLQDMRNVLTNSRLDNVRLVLNQMFAVSLDDVEDLRDLQSKPGGVIRVNKGQRPSDVLMPIQLPDVTSSSFEETDRIDDLVEKVSGVSGYQTGTDPERMNDTATGAAIIQEAGNERFGFKAELAELTGLTRLARHFGSIMQQFWTTDRVVRVLGEDGQYAWETFTPDSLTGSLDYQVEAGSSTQTESVRKQTAIELYQQLVGDPAVNQLALKEDLLRAYGKKDLDRYLAPAGPPVIDPATGQPIDPTTGQPVIEPPMEGEVPLEEVA